MPATDPADALDRLHAAASQGTLGRLCRRHGVRVLTVFGSVLRADAAPRDLDVGVLFEPDRDGDLLAVVNALIELTDCETLDVMDVGRAGPVARARALVGARPLYESEGGAYAQAQMGAALLEWDTAWMRELALDSLAS